MVAQSELLVLVDLTNMIHTDWYAANVKGGTKDVSQVTINRLRALAKFWPCQLIAAVDSRDCFRRRIEPTYKAHRADKPPHLVQQLRVTEEQTRQEFCVMDAAGYEADDVIATLSALASRAGRRSVIVSRDKDLRQCLKTGLVTMLESLRTERGGLIAKYCTADDVRTRYAVRADQWPEYQALVGDKTDGIRGCEHVGHVTAVKLLEQGSLAEILEDPWRCVATDCVRNALFAFRSRVDVVLQLVTLRTDVPGVEECLL